MRNLIKNELRNESGQGMTEYIIIVALIAIAAIAVITIFGKQVRHLFGMSASALSGQDVTQDPKSHTTTNKNLADFGTASDEAGSWDTGSNSN